MVNLLARGGCKTCSTAMCLVFPGACTTCRIGALQRKYRPVSGDGPGQLRWLRPARRGSAPAGEQRPGEPVVRRLGVHGAVGGALTPGPRHLVEPGAAPGDDSFVRAVWALARGSPDAASTGYRTPPRGTATIRRGTIRSSGYCRGLGPRAGLARRGFNGLPDPAPRNRDNTARDDSFVRVLSRFGPARGARPTRLQRVAMVGVQSGPGRHSDRTPARQFTTTAAGGAVVRTSGW